MADNAVILAAGYGKRMKTDIPKVLCEVLETPMIRWVLNACEAAGVENIYVVKGYGAEMLDEYLGGKYETVMQKERLGTGHAVMQAMELLKKDPDGNTLVLCGDAPFMDKETISAALEAHRSQGNAVTVVTAELDEPFGYGRIVRSENGISAIVEEKDATAEQKKIKEVSSSCYWFSTKALCDVLPEITANNAQGEYYLTDCVELILKKGLRASAYIADDPKVVMGANDRRALLELNEIARRDVIGKHLDNGVEFVCTDGIIISPEVSIGQGTKILPGVILRGKTFIGSNCVIGPNCIIEDTAVGNGVVLNNVQAYQSVVLDNAKIGPFVQLRPGTHIDEGVKIGDFVEIKNSTIGKKTAISHLTYVGDSEVGENVNMGGGCVTCNYDGERKFKTVIGNNAFIGCNTNLVAPVTIGEGAYTAAGSTITSDVPSGALAIERGRTTIKQDYAVKKLKARTDKFKNSQ